VGAVAGTDTGGFIGIKSLFLVAVSEVLYLNQEGGR
jgi:hypothetical protein